MKIKKHTTYIKLISQLFGAIFLFIIGMVVLGFCIGLGGSIAENLIDFSDWLQILVIAITYIIIVLLFLIYKIQTGAEDIEKRLAETEGKLLELNTDVDLINAYFARSYPQAKNIL